MEARLLAAVRDAASEAAGLDDELQFYAAAIALGYSAAIAEQIDITLTRQVMRSRGGI